MIKAPVKRELIQWACERSRRDPADLAERFPKLEDWQSGDDSPTLKQLEKFAAATHTPFGYFFLAQPPVETLPIPDFRTLGSARIKRPSPDLLDTIYLCQQRQDWYRQHARLMGEDPRAFVGSATINDSVVATAAAIRTALKLDLQERSNLPTWEDALRRLIEHADHLGVLVMTSGIVASNTHRQLDTAEFRGFALSDDLAPLIFVNGTDTKNGQQFTLVHELAHLWLGQSALSDSTPLSTYGSLTVEQWCNAVAAEVLVPLAGFSTSYRRKEAIAVELRRLSRQYKVSSLVILRRMFDAGGLSRARFNAAFDAELERIMAAMALKKAGGGNFYFTTAARVSPRFARAILASTWEGRSTFTEAFRLLGCQKVSSLATLGESLGIGPPVSHIRVRKEDE